MAVSKGVQRRRGRRRSGSPLRLIIWRNCEGLKPGDTHEQLECGHDHYPDPFYGSGQPDIHLWAQHRKCSKCSQQAEQQGISVKDIPLIQVDDEWKDPNNYRGADWFSLNIIDQNGVEDGRD